MATTLYGLHDYISFIQWQSIIISITLHWLISCFTRCCHSGMNHQLLRQLFYTVNIPHPSIQYKEYNPQCWETPTHSFIHTLQIRFNQFWTVGETGTSRGNHHEHGENVQTHGLLIHYHSNKYKSIASAITWTPTVYTKPGSPLLSPTPPHDDLKTLCNSVCASLVSGLDKPLVEKTIVHLADTLTNTCTSFVHLHKTLSYNHSISLKMQCAFIKCALHWWMGLTNHL